MSVVNYSVKSGNYMSRIGNTPITLPEGVTATIESGRVVITGPKGSLSAPLHPKVKAALVDGELKITRSSEDPAVKAMHGLVRSVLNNHVVGVTEGYAKTLNLVGTGYRVQAKGKGLSLSVGYSHPVDVQPVDGVTFAVEGNDTITVSGIDKHLVGQVTANIRKIKPPEPYQGKGIRYKDEVVRRKQGKAAA